MWLPKNSIFQQPLNFSAVAKSTTLYFSLSLFDSWWEWMAIEMIIEIRIFESTETKKFSSGLSSRVEKLNPRSKELWFNPFLDDNHFRCFWIRCNLIDFWSQRIIIVRNFIDTGRNSCWLRRWDFIENFWSTWRRDFRYNFVVLNYVEIGKRIVDKSFRESKFRQMVASLSLADNSNFLLARHPPKLKWNFKD